MDLMSSGLFRRNLGVIYRWRIEDPELFSFLSKDIFVAISEITYFPDIKVSEFAVLLPMPCILSIGNGHSFVWISFVYSSVMPKGFFISDAIFERNLLLEIPIEHQRPRLVLISSMILLAAWMGDPNRCSVPVISSQASSMLFCSNIGV